MTGETSQHLRGPATTPADLLEQLVTANGVTGPLHPVTCHPVTLAVAGLVAQDGGGSARDRLGLTCCDFSNR